jgi:hypothetical protein
MAVQNSTAALAGNYREPDLFDGDRVWWFPL